VDGCCRAIACGNPRRENRTDDQAGAELVANGDVAAARLEYHTAAEAVDAIAAFALAETCGPLVPAKGGVPPDIGLARM
jgi:hypothetical protein